MRKATAAIGTVVSALLLAGCSSSATGGNAQPASTTSATTGTESGSSPGNPDVPRVPKPLDTAKFQQDPCSVLTKAQLQALHIGAQGSPADINDQPNCRWPDTFGPSQMSVSVTFMTKGDGLAGLYSRSSTFKVFRPFQIDGYPAAVVLAFLDQRSQGVCDVDVAVTDKLVYLVQAKMHSDAPDYTTPCERTKTVAGEVLKTLKAAS
ncbi:hypothetical protein GCM10012275_43550 [Longimycelium tulufanense]|uniref:DUF3558 domain-containing protein n=1 Tax=Longimycelium tulufanense TaxID=907463 RepID=A0A8J3CB45_9PSEU|nr:DUF3558 domain-containing protein [Longimycelium tulufanense]GGM68340.1 hypothetical protein GCM10012275_43550 [Longimycelium tulufanense]